MQFTGSGRMGRAFCDDLHTIQLLTLYEAQQANNIIQLRPERSGGYQDLMLLLSPTTSSLFFESLWSLFCALSLVDNALQ
jgi:hypothetical protein